MPRTLRTLLLSATALVSLVTAATAAATTPPSNHPAGAGMANLQEAMAADCPMHLGDAMASMHRDTGHDPTRHHRPPGGDRP